MWESRKIKHYVNDSCPSKLSQHSAENLAGTQSKFKGKSLLHVNKGKELLVGLALGDNNCMQVEGSFVHHCGCVVYGNLAC